MIVHEKAGLPRRSRAEIIFISDSPHRYTYFHFQVRSNLLFSMLRGFTEMDANDLIFFAIDANVLESSDAFLE